MTGAELSGDQTADPLSSFTLADALRERARSYPNGQRVVCGEVRLTFPELHRRVGGLATGLASLGVGRGSRVLWLGQNCHALFEMTLACGWLGAVACPANWRLSQDELLYLADDLAPAVIICQRDAFDDAALSVCRAATSSAWVDAPAARPSGHSDVPYDELVGQPVHEDVGVDDREPALAIYTAAFSGRPKAALLSHTALVTHSLSLALLQHLTSDAVYLNCGPMFHMGTLMGTFATFLAGGKNVFVPRLEPDAVVAAVVAEECQRAFLPPPILDSIADEARAGNHRLPSLLVDAGQPQLAEFGVPDNSPWGRRPGGYGQTEVTAILTASALGDVDGVGSYGRPIPVAEVAILDPDGAELPPGETGEIAARGPTVSLGYLGQPDATAERRVGRWLRTNDIGRREVDGSVTFLGPIGRLIKSGGENVYPAEVEQCIRGLEEIHDVAVLGLPDERWGEVVAALFVAADGVKAASVAQTVDAHCRSRLAAYKRPREVRVVESIPRNASGTLDVNAARGMF